HEPPGRGPRAGPTRRHRQGPGARPGRHLRQRKLEPRRAHARGDARALASVRGSEGNDLRRDRSAPTVPGDDAARDRRAERREAGPGRCGEARTRRRRSARELRISAQPGGLQGGTSAAAADQDRRPRGHLGRSPIRDCEMIALAAALALSMQPGGSPPPDIDLLPAPAAPDPAAVARQEQLDRELRTRRSMLQLHQVGGLLTLASLGATVIFGQLNYNDLYGGGGYTRRWYDWHRYSAFTSAALFAGTGALALFAPSPLEKRMRLDTAMLHRIAMGVATAGLATQIVLGFVTANKGGSLSQRDFALAHQIVGYSTFGATAVGFGVLLF